jgi:hypothetical protein
MAKEGEAKKLRNQKGLREYYSDSCKQRGETLNANEIIKSMNLDATQSEKMTVFTLSLLETMHLKLSASVHFEEFFESCISESNIMRQPINWQLLKEIRARQPKKWNTFKGMAKSKSSKVESAPMPKSWKDTRDTAPQIAWHLKDILELPAGEFVNENFRTKIARDYCAREYRPIDNKVIELEAVQLIDTYRIKLGLEPRLSPEIKPGSIEIEKNDIARLIDHKIENLLTESNVVDYPAGSKDPLEFKNYYQEKYANRPEILEWVNTMDASGVIPISSTTYPQSEPRRLFEPNVTRKGDYVIYDHGDKVEYKHEPIPEKKESNSDQIAVWLKTQKYEHVDASLRSEVMKMAEDMLAVSDNSEPSYNPFEELEDLDSPLLL